MRRLLKYRKTIAGILFFGAFVIIVFLWFLSNKKTDEPAVFVKPQKHTVTKSIKVDGNIFSDSSLTLQAEASGKLVRVNTKEGKRVQKGELLAVVDNSAEVSALTSALAQLKQAKSELEKALNGAQIEDKNIAKISIDVAKEKVRVSRQKAGSDLQSLCYALQTSKTLIDTYFLNAETATPKINLPVIGGGDKLTLENKRVGLEGSYSTGICASLENILDNKEFILNTSRNFLNFFDLFINTLKASINKDNKLRDKLLAPISALSSGRDLLSSKINLAQISFSNLQVAEVGVAQAKESYNKVLAGTRKEDISVLQASVALKESQVQSARSALAKTYIYSPENAVVSKLYKKEGEYISRGAPFADLTARNFYIKALVPEVDLPKVKDGQIVFIVFDAYKEKPITGKLLFVYPEKIVKSGIVYFNAKIELFEEQIKGLNIFPGMSLDVIIPYEQVNANLALPKKFIKKDNKGYYVLIKNDKGAHKKYIKIGLYGNEFVEIISGLNEKDSVTEIKYE